MAHDYGAIVAPMLAKAVTAIPSPDSIDGGLSFEPKWDGFRAIVSFDGETVEIGSRGSKPLTRYFPELTAALASQLPGPCVLDGEIVVRSGTPGNEIHFHVPIYMAMGKGTSKCLCRSIS